MTTSEPTNHIIIKAECECDPFEACYRLDENGLCDACGLPCDPPPEIDDDTACPRCHATGWLLNGAVCDVCEGRGWLW